MGFSSPTYCWSLVTAPRKTTLFWNSQSPVKPWDIRTWDIYIYKYWLVVLTTLENMSSSMGRIIPYIMENNTYSKPPTSKKQGGPENPKAKRHRANHFFLHVGKAGEKQEREKKW